MDPLTPPLVSSDDLAKDDGNAKKLTARRFENEVYMLQSDRRRLVRQSNELDAEVRVLEKALSEKEFELEERRTERSRIIQKVQDIDGEILRVKREINKR